MKDVILSETEYIISVIKGYDNSINCPTSKFMSILDMIDKDTSITEKSLHNQFNLVNRKIGFYLLRKNQRSKALWLQENSKQILYTLYVYRCLKNSIITVDESLYEWFYNNIDEAIIDTYTEDNSFIFYLNRNLYFVEKDSKSVTVSELNSRLRSQKSGNPSFNIKSEDGCDVLRILCNNTSCPRWKNSLEPAYDDNSKYCGCDLSDTQKCKYLTECGKLEPLDAVLYAKAIIYCMHNNRSEYKGIRVIGEKGYEHIPKPERLDDVIVYYGFKKPSERKSKSDNDSPFPASHASPREHQRRGGERRGYYRKDGVYVKPTTFKATVVNKGHTKTNYTLRQRKED